MVTGSRGQQAARCPVLSLATVLLINMEKPLNAWTSSSGNLSELVRKKTRVGKNTSALHASISWISNGKPLRKYMGRTAQSTSNWDNDFLWVKKVWKLRNRSEMARSPARLGALAATIAVMLYIEQSTDGVRLVLMETSISIGMFGAAVYTDAKFRWR